MPLIDLGNRTWKLPHISGEEIILGRGSAGTFLPKLSMPCFLGESKLNFLPQVLALNAEAQGDELVAENSNYKFIWRSTGIVPGFNERGGIDMIPIMKRKPPRNYLEYGYDATKLIPYHQPELTAQEIAEGCIRPDHVVNSIAWYHNTKGGLVTPSDKARFITTGKAFHTYRMKAIDAVGNWTWLNWLLGSGNIVRAEIDQTFLNMCVYPVIISPVGDTFGFESEGGSSSGSNRIRACKFTSGANAGTSTQISINGHSTAGYTIGAAIYSDVAGAITNKLAVDTGNVDFEAAGWHDVPISYGILANTVYWLCGWSSSTGTIHYDAGGSSQGALSTTTSFENWPDPTFDTPTYANRKYSIHCDYTPSAGGWANIKNIRAGTGVITATDLSHIWFGTTAVAVADIAEIPTGVAV